MQAGVAISISTAPPNRPVPATDSKRKTLLLVIAISAVALGALILLPSVLPLVAFKAKVIVSALSFLLSGIILRKTVHSPAQPNAVPKAKTDNGPLGHARVLEAFNELETVIRHNVEIEGLFRIPGTKTQQDNFFFNLSNPNFDIKKATESLNVHTACGALKSLLHYSFLDIICLDEAEMDFQSARKAYQTLLSQEKKELFCRTLDLFVFVTQHADRNLMKAQALAGSTHGLLIRPMNLMSQEMIKRTNALMQEIIENADKFTQESL